MSALENEQEYHFLDLEHLNTLEVCDRGHLASSRWTSWFNTCTK
jgi:hypothetical protein